MSEKMRARFPAPHSAPHLTAALRRSWRIEVRGMHTSADPEPYGRAPKLCLVVMNIHIFSPVRRSAVKSSALNATVCDYVWGGTAACG